MRTAFQKLSFLDKESSKNNQQIYRIYSLDDIQQVFQRLIDQYSSSSKISRKCWEK